MVAMKLGRGGGAAVEKRVAKHDPAGDKGRLRERPLACVLGNMNLIRALGLAGIRCAAVARPDTPPAFSRFVDARVEWADNWGAPDRLLLNLMQFAKRAPTPPVLFFQHDGDLTFVSHHRD